jgi:carbon-monoxide dehydrogenase medium subunit
MNLPEFEVLVPRTVEEACAMLAEHAGRGAAVLAGGTDLLVDLKRPIIPQHVPRCDGCQTHPDGQILSTVDCGAWQSDPLMSGEGALRTALKRPDLKIPAYLVSLHKLTALKGIQVSGDGGLCAGALTTITEIQQSEAVRSRWTALADGADNLGSPLVRNRGTLGGNIANARPAGDAAVPTVGLGAELTLQGPSGRRTVTAEDFPIGPGQTVIEPGEILTAVTYPAPPPHAGSAYYKLATRKVLDISVVGVSAFIALEKPGGPVIDVRVGLGAVAPKPILSPSVRDVLMDQIPDEKRLEQAAEAAAADCRPIDDHRGSAWYRVRMVRTLTKRMLKLALARAGGAP